MSTPRPLLGLLDSMQSATDALFDALDVAGPALDAAFGSEGPLAALEGSRYDSTRVHVARALVHSEMARVSSEDLDGWRLARKAGPNCPVWLANGAHSIRLLHTWSPSVVPPTGRNRARVSYYSNKLLDGHPQELFASHRFLMLWERTAADFTLRLVHTLGAVRLNREAQLDLDVYLQRGVAYADMAFEQRDDDLEFFGQDVEQEEDGNASAS